MTVRKEANEQSWMLSVEFVFLTNASAFSCRFRGTDVRSQDRSPAETPSLTEASSVVLQRGEELPVLHVWNAGWNQWTMFALWIKPLNSSVFVLWNWYLLTNKIFIYYQSVVLPAISNILEDLESFYQLTLEKYIYLNKTDSFIVTLKIYYIFFSWLK